MPMYEWALNYLVSFAVSRTLNTTVKLPVRVGVDYVPQGSDRVLKLILRHLSNVAEEIIEILKAICKVEIHFVWEVIRIHSEQSVLIDSKFIILALVFLVIIIEFSLLSINDEVRSQTECWAQILDI
jgi:hypothetical protein